jgi:hypothetical protein
MDNIFIKQNDIIIFDEFKEYILGNQISIFDV